MKLSDDVIIPASRETVWKALNDPHVLKQCIPGCESITKHSDTSMEAKVTIKLGPVKASYKGAVTLSDLDPPNGYRISGEGKSLMGSASGGADVRLESVPEGTKLSYDVDAQVGGKIAGLAARFIEPTSRMLAGQFFEKLAAVAAKMEPAQGAAAGSPKKAAAKKPAAKKPAAKKTATKKAAAKKPAAKTAAKKPAKKKR
jgi:carbon monoxide dehydrogenase subunit G